VPVDSSAASIPFPGAQMAFAVSMSSALKPPAALAAAGASDEIY